MAPSVRRHRPADRRGPRRPRLFRPGLVGPRARPPRPPGACATPCATQAAFRPRPRSSRGPDDHQEPEPPLSVLCTELNVPLMLVPRLLITVTQTTTIRASITAYSTAVGPSSLTRKFRTREKTPFISNSFAAMRQPRGGKVTERG